MTEIGELLEKNAPKKLDDFLGGFMAKQELKKFLDGPTPPPGKNVLLVLGASGGGKTALCKLAMGLVGEAGSNARFTVTRPQYDQFLKHTDLEVFMNNFLTTRTLLEMMGTRPKIVFLDDVDMLLSQDRFAQSYLLEVFAKYPNVRFLLTSAEEKRVTDLKKKSMITTVKIAPPSPGELLIFITKVLDEGGYEADAEELLGVIKEAGCNVRGVFNALVTQPDECEEDAQHKYYQDLDIFPLVAGILSRWDGSLQDLEIAISTDTTLMSYMMHENYMPWIVAKGGCAANVFESMRNVNNTFREIATLEPEVPEFMDLIRAYTIRLAQRCSFGDGKPNTAPPPQLTFSKAIASNTQGKKLNAMARARGVSVDNLCIMAELVYMNGADVPAPVKAKKKKPTAPAGNPEEFIPYQQVFCRKEHSVFRVPTLEEQMLATHIGEVTNASMQNTSSVKSVRRKTVKKSEEMDTSEEPTPKKRTTKAKTVATTSDLTSHLR